MARQLTDKQQKFLDVLFEEAGGSVTLAKKLAGYSETSSTSDVTKGLKDEILEATQLYMARNAPQAAVAIAGSLSCLLYTSPSPRDGLLSRMPSSA